MKEEEVFRELKSVGCCNGCCARFIGLRNPASYADVDILPSKYMSSNSSDTLAEGQTDSHNGAAKSFDNKLGNGSSNGDDNELFPSKRFKWSVCVCCLGVMQKQTWQEAIDQVIESLEKRSYESDTFACALSSPPCIALREKSLQFHLEDKIPDFKIQTITPLKEAWKWSFGNALAAGIGKTLDSGAVSPLLITINYDYERDQEELDSLRDMAPEYYSARHRLLRRPETTRRCVTDVLQTSGVDLVRSKFGVPPPEPSGHARPMSVRVCHAPIYIAGRYIKLSRQLSQTPWLVDGEKMMESSVQDIIFAPIAKFFGISSSERDAHLKLIGAGREDVDVRCLGTGRPFAVEVTDPARLPGEADLEAMCREVGRTGEVVVRRLRIAGRDDMTLLKKGEEFKEKTYKALCIKLPEDIGDLTSKEGHTCEVTDQDIETIRSYTNSDGSCRVKIEQKTPIRVLHRRPLLTRERKILHMDADKVPGHSNLFTVDLRTEAGTYVKEFVHGDFGRTRPCLRDVLGANVDILALDVTQVHLDW